MIDQLLFAIASVATIQQADVKRRDEQYVIIGKSNITPTVTNIENLFPQIGLNNSSLITYQNLPFQKVASQQDEYMSLVKKSLPVTTRVIVGGRVAPLPIDDEEIVYFDE